MNTLLGKIPFVARILLGFVFTFFGLNGFLNFLTPPPPTGAAAEFLGGLAAAGYFFPLLAATEIVTGILLLTGRFVPLALTVLAPVIVNIIFYHVALSPQDMVPAILVLALEIYLAWSYRDSFASVLRSRAAPLTSVSESVERPLSHA